MELEAGGFDPFPPAGGVGTTAEEEGRTPGADTTGTDNPGVSFATGQTVVYRAIVSVVTFPILAGQLVTSGAQEVTMYTLVVYTVEVVYFVTEDDEDGDEDIVVPVGPAGEPPLPWACVTGQIVV